MANFHSAVYSNADSTAVLADYDSLVGVVLSETDTPEEWADMMAQVVPDPFEPPAITPRDVETEMKRRIALLYNGDSATAETLIWQHLQMKVTDGGTLNGPEQTEWDKQKARAANVTPIYQAAKALVAMNPIPADYEADSYWPPVPS